MGFFFYKNGFKNNDYISIWDLNLGLVLQLKLQLKTRFYFTFILFYFSNWGFHKFKTRFFNNWGLQF